MTLIAAFRCFEGVVLCADQQETIGDVRVAVNKLTPEDAGEHYQLAIAGSGNGDLIDGFAYKLKLDIANWSPDADETTVYGYLDSLTQEFYENQVAYYPTDSVGDKLNHFLVCIKPKKRPDIFLWELRGTAIVPVGDYTLLGVGASIYKHELRRLYKTNQLRGLQAVLLGVHLFTLARETSNYVGGQTDVIFVRDNGMYVEDAKYIKGLEQRLESFNEYLADLMLACPDTSVDPGRFTALLEAFSEAVTVVRGIYMKQAVSDLIKESADPNYRGDAYAKLPAGSIVRFGDDEKD